MTNRPTGVGLGLRHELSRELFETRPREVAWVEIHPENFIGRGGTFAAMLEEARARYDVVTHGLTQCVGSPDPLDLDYVARLRALLRDNRARWHSEHLAWSNLGGRFSHDLLPMPFTRASVRRAAETIRELRDRLGLDVAIEERQLLRPSRWAGDERDRVPSRRSSRPRTARSSSTSTTSG
jgi:uncharacterized protein (UPF0276 family)